MNRCDITAGRNPAAEAIRSGRPIEKVIIQDGATGSVGRIISDAKRRGIRVEYAPKRDLDRIAAGISHQGVIAVTAPHDYASLEDIYANGEKPGRETLIVILDDIADPQNLGAIMRTAECMGAAGVVIPKKGGAGLTETVAKTSAGAIEYMPVARVANIARTIDELKENGYWIAALDMDGSRYDDADLTGRLAVVVGSEGRGVGRLIKEKCDFVLSIPMTGKISSLNASNAAAIVMYESRRQRDRKNDRR